MFQEKEIDTLVRNHFNQLSTCRADHLTFVQPVKLLESLSNPKPAWLEKNTPLRSNKCFKKGTETTEQEEMKSYGECEGKKEEDRSRVGGELRQTDPDGPGLRSSGMRVMSSSKAAFSVVRPVQGVYYQGCCVSGSHWAKTGLFLMLGLGYRDVTADVIPLQVSSWNNRFIFDYSVDKIDNNTQTDNIIKGE